MKNSLPGFELEGDDIPKQGESSIFSSAAAPMFHFQKAWGLVVQTAVSWVLGQWVWLTVHTEAFAEPE